MMIRILFVTILFLLLGGCASKDDSLNGVEKHTLKSGKLKLLMHNMDMVIYDRYKSELDRDNARRRYALTLANNIKKVSSQMEQLSTDRFSKDMDKKDIVFFRKYIKELYKKGEDIYQLAQNYELEKLDSKLQDLERTCNGCHSKFRAYQ